MQTDILRHLICKPEMVTVRMGTSARELATIPSGGKCENLEGASNVPTDVPTGSSRKPSGPVWIAVVSLLPHGVFFSTWKFDRRRQTHPVILPAYQSHGSD